MSRIAFQFPGQGSQFVGMGADLAAARAEAKRTFEEADDVLGSALSRLCWDGPEEELRATENAQPALLTHSIAVARVLAVEGIEPQSAAGHSLGEFSAHVVAGSLSFSDGLRLVRARGEAMAATGREKPGTMAALIGIDSADAFALCDTIRAPDEVLTPANFNAPGQIVVSGSVSAVRRAIEEAPNWGARKAVELNVSGAFHSSLMAPAARELSAVLEAIDVQTATHPVVANVDAEAVTQPDAIRSRLLEQLTAPVRWVDCVTRLRDLGAT
ncbi:MAG: ACP S-malonyltransferase, partial [Gemmatimonadetes bacterium]|nr:ACP S-malonyltransferase [Gemmatimonadota bacterium]